MNSFKPIIVSGFLFAACSAEEPAAQSPPVCSASLSIVRDAFESNSMFNCVDSTIEATFEFDPDTPPEVRSLELSLIGTDDEDFQCSIDLSLPTICKQTGGFTYPSHSDHLVATAALSDCPGVPDDVEGDYSFEDSVVSLRKIDSGDQAGNFAEEPLQLVIAGNIDLYTIEKDMSIIGSFIVSGMVTGVDVEDGNCGQGSSSSSEAPPEESEEESESSEGSEENQESETSQEDEGE